MAKLKEIYDYIDTIAPFNRKMEFDNCGLLVGDLYVEVARAVVTLDITEQVIREAVKLGANLIISHHPVIFNPLKSLSSGSIPYMLAENNICAICAHTNLDFAEDIGVNATLGRRLRLQDIKPLTYCNHLPFVLAGSLASELEPESFALFVKEALGCSAVRFAAGNKPVKTVAFCCGGAGDMFTAAIENNIDAYVSGDIRHHEMLAARHSGLTLVDAGHFPTENIVIAPLTELLNEQFSGIKFSQSEVNRDIVTYV